MEEVILAIARFRNDQKEAMSKNFVNLAKSLTKNGRQVSTVSPTPFISDFGIEQHTLRNQSRYESLIEGLVNLVLLSNKVNQLLKKKPMAKVNIHIATPIELLVVFLFLKSRHHKQTTLSIWQSYLTYEEVRANGIFFLRNWFNYFHLLVFNSFISAPLYRWLLRYFQQAIVHSKYQKWQLTSQSNLPIHFVQNGVFSKQFVTPKAKLTDNRSKVSLLYIGHAKPSKGVDVLIELVATLKKRGLIGFELTLCLSGFGNHKNIEKLVKIHNLDTCTYFKEDVDVALEMAKADLLILPLRTCVGTSLTPNLIVEAAACGLPIAMPEFVQLADVIQFETNAIKIDLKDMTASARTIEKCFEKDRLESLSKNQLKQFKENFTLEAFTFGYSQKLGLE